MIRVCQAKGFKWCCSSYFYLKFCWMMFQWDVSRRHCCNMLSPLLMLGCTLFFGLFWWDQRPLPSNMSKILKSIGHVLATSLPYSGMLLCDTLCPCTPPSHAAAKGGDVSSWELLSQAVSGVLHEHVLGVAVWWLHCLSSGLWREWTGQASWRQGGHVSSEFSLL